MLDMSGEMACGEAQCFQRNIASDAKRSRDDLTVTSCIHRFTIQNGRYNRKLATSAILSLTLTFQMSDFTGS